MSLYSQGFKNEDGVTAFLGGIVSEAADNASFELSNKLDIQYISFEADIFKIKSSIQQSIKDRLKDYWISCYAEDENDINEVLNNSTFDFIEIPEILSIKEVFFGMWKNYLETEDEANSLLEIADTFENKIFYHTNHKQITVYSVKCNTNILSKFYTYIIFDCKAVFFDDYFLLMFSGSDE